MNLLYHASLCVEQEQDKETLLDKDKLPKLLRSAVPISIQTEEKNITGVEDTSSEKGCVSLKNKTTNSRKKTPLKSRSSEWSSNIL